MGGGSSTADTYRHAHNLRRSDAEVVQLMMPVYFTYDDPNLEDIQLARTIWAYIIEDTSPEFQRRKGTPGFDYASCVMFFYDMFYTRLFDVHPMSRSMFKTGLKTQGKFLVKIISIALSEIDDNDNSKFVSTLTALAENHNKKGVKAIEYGIVGEVMFWTIKTCIGEEAFDKSVQNAWVRIFSRMLKIMVPVAVAHELRNGGDAQSERVEVEQAMQKQAIEASRDAADD